MGYLTFLVEDERVLSAWYVHSRNGGYAFDDGCVRMMLGNVTFNHREDHLHCYINIIIDTCDKCYPDLLSHVLRRKQGLRKISPSNRTPNICDVIGYVSNAYNILNICINYPKYRPCGKNV